METIKISSITRFDYLGPFIHGIAEYRIGGNVGYINEEYKEVDKKGNLVEKKI